MCSSSELKALSLVSCLLSCNNSVFVSRVAWVEIALAEKRPFTKGLIEPVPSNPSVVLSRLQNADRSGFPTFTVSYYNGAVTFSAEGFLDRNLDAIARLIVSTSEVGDKDDRSFWLVPQLGNADEGIAQLNHLFGER